MVGKFESREEPEREKSSDQYRTRDSQARQLVVGAFVQPAVLVSGSISRKSIIQRVLDLDGLVVVRYGTAV